MSQYQADTECKELEDKINSFYVTLDFINRQIPFLE